MAGIYIHIPFCRQKCSYCNFYFSVSMKTKDELLIAILKEIDLNHHYLENDKLQSVYFGGGTPSVLKAGEIEAILNKINKYFSFDNDIEITLEANPDDINKEYLNTLQQAGINRFSMGIQSFHDEELLILNRSHNAAKAIQSLEMIASAGFESTNIDLIFGIPGSNRNKWKQNLDIFLQMDIPHLSCYNLTIEPQTAIAHQIKTGVLNAPSDDFGADIFLFTHQYLNDNGFEHYEISNYAKDSKYALHNTNYWKGAPYLGIGPSAHSFNGDTRQWNVANNRKYIEKIKDNIVPATVETLTTTDKYNEYIMTGLRTMWGVNKSTILDIGQEFYIHFMKNIDKFVAEKMIKLVNSSYILTERGMLYADRVASELFA